MKIELKRVNKAVHLVATNEAGNEVHIDGAPSIGGENMGARPMELLIMGLGGCSTMDIISILTKQKEVIDDYKVTINANRDQENTPSLFTDIHVAFQFYGELNKKKVDRAVNLSMEKYCSVTKILEKSAEITWSFTINA